MFFKSLITYHNVCSADAAARRTLQMKRTIRLSNGRLATFGSQKRWSGQKEWRTDSLSVSIFVGTSYRMWDGKHEHEWFSPSPISCRLLTSSPLASDTTALYEPASCIVTCASQHCLIVVWKLAFSFLSTPPPPHPPTWSSQSWYLREGERADPWRLLVLVAGPLGAVFEPL